MAIWRRCILSLALSGLVLSASACGSNDDDGDGLVGSCDDGRKNGDETGIDCGGSCLPCFVGESCNSPGDCASLSCVDKVCACLPGKVPDEEGRCQEFDPCADDPCGDHGICVRQSTTYQCACSFGHYGAECTLECSVPAGCAAGANVTCSSATNATCSACTPGFYGASCAETCSVGDSCAGGQVTCHQITGELLSCGNCADGFWGAACDTACVAPGCAASADILCDSTTGAVSSCSACVTGFYGAFCAQSCDTPATCADGVEASCQQDDGQLLTCGDCAAGYWGALCESPCAAAPATCAAAAQVWCAQDDGALVSCSVCEAGHWGELCAEECVKPDACSGDAEVSCAQEDGGNVQCTECNLGYSGDDCSDVNVTSCLDLRLASGGDALPSGVYKIDPDGPGTGSEPFWVYCDMQTAGGGWTMVLKADGEQDTFAYGALAWVDSATVSPAEFQLDRTEAKLASFMTVPLTEMLVALESPMGTDALILETLRVPVFAPSAHGLFAAGEHVSTSLGDDAWMGLVAAGSLETECQAEGFNVGAEGAAQVRVGIVGSDAIDCSDADSRLGIGGVGGDDTTTGNVSSSANEAAFGVLFVRELVGESCEDLFEAGFEEPGTYAINAEGLEGDEPTHEHCDMIF